MRQPAPTWDRNANGDHVLTEYAPLKWWQRKPRPIRAYVIPESVMLDVGRDTLAALHDAIAAEAEADATA